MKGRQCCDMKGFLSFMVLRLISKGYGSGEELRKEIEKRKGTKPSPGTIYPVLKLLTMKGLIKEATTEGKEKKYVLTPRGKRELKVATRTFISMFCDMEEEFKK